MKRRFDDGLQRERGIYHYGFLPCGRQRVCAGRPFDSAPAIRYLEMHRPEGLLLGPLFQRPVFRPKGFGGAGVLEVVEDYHGNTWRAVYTIQLKNAVYVLHVFQKKSVAGKATPKPEIDLIYQRLKAAQRHAQESGYVI